MYCPRCHERISEGWRFCPRCGARLPSTSQSGEEQTPFAEMFKEIERQMKEVLGADFSKDIEFFDLKPEFVKKNPFFKSGGFRIKISRSGDGPPTIDIKAFGDIDEELAKRMQEAMRARSAEMAKSATAGQEAGAGTTREEEEPRTIFRRVSQYREPRCVTKWLGDHLLVDLDLSGVKSSSDIDVRKIGESIEVRAYAGDKGYFKILGVPEDSKVLNKEFKDGKLRLEIG